MGSSGTYHLYNARNSCQKKLHLVLKHLQLRIMVVQQRCEAFCHWTINFACLMQSLVQYEKFGQYSFICSENRKERPETGLDEAKPRDLFVHLHEVQVPLNLHIHHFICL